MTKLETLKPQRNYKSRLFVMIFSEPERLLELYNAVSGKAYQDPAQLTINTLENAIYMSMANDMSFLIDSRLSLYEHQSTYNPNMPLRFLFYLADLYSAMTMGKNLYGTSSILLPPPRFLVFYNGLTEMPDRQELLLSDSYQVKESGISLELKVDMLNINAGHNRELMEASRTLREYAEYVRRVRLYAEEMTIQSAVERAITECIKEGILREFLEKNRAEARAVSIYEYNEEEHMRMEREDYFERGRLAEQANTERERKRADEACQERDEACQERDEANQRAQLAEAEVERLKRELDKFQKD